MLDKDGRPSDNPADYLEGGVLLPFGGYKGYGLALMVESFAAVLSGAAITRNVHAWNCTPGTSGNVGHFFMALDISRMCGTEEFGYRIEQIIDEIKGSALADGAEQIFYPGEKELIQRAKCQETGMVYIDEEVLAYLKSL